MPGASVLARKYQDPEDQTYEVPEPRQPPMNHPTAFMVGAQQHAQPFMPHAPRTVVPPNVLPDGVPYRGGPPDSSAVEPAPQTPQAPSASPAATLARGGAQQQAPGQQAVPRGWTKERMAEADELNKMGKMYKQNVEARRAKRKALTQYDRIKGQLETSATAIQDLRELKQTYDKDDPHSMNIQRKIMQHLIKGERLHKQLQSMSADLSKTHKMPLDKQGFLQDYDDHLAQDDEQFDSDAMETLAEAYGRSPSQ